MNYKKKKRKQKRKGLFLIIVIMALGTRHYITHQTNDYTILGSVIPQDNRVLQQILDNKDEYPEELIELAVENEEAVDFVYDYPSLKDKSIETWINNDLKEGEIPLYIQWDRRWGYNQYGDSFMAINGCGPTSLAMVATGLTGDGTITPYAVAQFSEEKGYYVNRVGTSWELMTEGAKYFGIKGEEIPLDENIIIQKLREGKPIIASMGAGTFTRKGHFIVLVGVTKDNQIIVNDSNSKIKSMKTWDLEVFINEIKNLWAFEVL